MDDPADGGVLLFGGLTPFNVVLNDTWLFHEGVWTELCTGSTAPPACPASPVGFGSSSTYPWAAYDPPGREVVLVDPNGYTWVFHDGGWFNESGSTTITGGPMAYDAAEGSVLMFSTSGQTWGFANDTWTRFHPAAPVPTSAGPLFFDASLGEAIMWNGATWGFSNGNWSTLNTTTSPPNLGSNSAYNIQSGYDASAGYGVLYYDLPPNHNVTWLFENETWVNATASVGQPTWGGDEMAYDSTDGYTVLLLAFYWSDTLNETWLLANPLGVNLSSSVSVADVGQTVNYTAQVTGRVAPYTLRIMSAPPGCPTTANASRTTLIPCELTEAGTFHFATVVTDATGRSVNLSLALSVNPALVVDLEVAPNPTTVDVPVRMDATVAGGTSPIHETWHLADGATGSGPSLDHAFTQAGVIFGQFTVTDGAGSTLDNGFEVVVHRGLGVGALVSQNVTDVGIPLTLTTTVAGGTTPYGYAWSFGDLSSGI